MLLLITNIKNLNKVVIILLLLPFLLQCQKDKDEKVSYLTKWEDASNQHRISYERNTEGKLIKASSYHNGRIYHYDQYIFNIHELQKIESYDVRYYGDTTSNELTALHSLSRKGNNLEYINYYLHKPYTLPSSKGVYIMGENGEYKREDFYLYDTSKASWRYTLYSNFEYYGDTTLLIKQYNANNSLIGTTTLTFDKMKNPMENFDFLALNQGWNNFFPLRFKHNLIRLQAVNTDRQSNYTYNSDGYPLTLGTSIFYYEKK